MHDERKLSGLETFWLESFDSKYENGFQSRTAAPAQHLLALQAADHAQRQGACALAAPMPHTAPLRRPAACARSSAPPRLQPHDLRPCALSAACMHCDVAMCWCTSMCWTGASVPACSIFFLCACVYFKVCTCDAANMRKSAK